MSINKKLEIYFKGSINKINHLVKRPGSKYSIADFHKLRIEIKKVKAVFKLLEHCSDRFSKKHLLSLYKRVFKNAGKVRELQVARSLFKKRPDSIGIKNYLLHLKVREAKMKKGFFQNLDRIAKQKPSKIETELKPVMDELSRQKVRKYLDRLETKVSKLGKKKNIDDKEIHELRKKMKTIYYTGKSTGVVPEKGSLKKDEFILELIGKWHDYARMCRQIEGAVESGVARQEEQTKLNQVGKSLREKRKALRKKVKVSLK